MVFSGAVLPRHPPVYLTIMCSIDTFCYLFQNGVDSIARSIEKQRSSDNVANKSKTWELTEIVDPVQFRTVTMPDSTDPTNKVFPTALDLKGCLNKYIPIL